MTTSRQKKQWVKERYGVIAAGKRQGCCDAQPLRPLRQAQGSPGCEAAPDVAERIGYSAEEVKAVPDGANLGLGCGNPLAIDSIVPGEIVLDLGSGAGFDAFLAAQRVGPTGLVIGVDMTPQMIRRARATAKRGGYSNVEFRRGDIEALPVEDGLVDLVISNCVLNLVPDKRKAFAEIARVLKPGGRIAIADIVLDQPLPKALEDDPDAHCSCIAGAMMRADYLRGLEQAGLSEVRVVAEADAAELLAGDCGVTARNLAGVVTSVHVSGRKPRRTGPSSPLMDADGCGSAA